MDDGADDCIDGCVDDCGLEECGEVERVGIRNHQWVPGPQGHRFSMYLRMMSWHSYKLLRE